MRSARAVCLLSLLLPARLPAQFVVRSWLEWRTIETPHFAFHYPAELEAWTRAVASRIEAIDSAVARDVGYAPARRTDIIVDDPYQTANGSAWPFLNRPIINLWANPPSPREDIGEFRDWGTTLVAHEFTHIAHLTRPSRNPAFQRLWKGLAVDLGPIALRAPRWAIEGYATYVEGRVTGSGRPHGAWRAAFLREWAIEGQLPRYDQLDAWGAYNGGEFAYLAGSAFLEWLVARQGEHSLVDVWRRLSARQNRTFDDAFAGVFGESARVLYGRFTAELTARAMNVHRVTAAVGDTGAIVQRLARSTGDPAISPDGRRIALVVRSATLPSRVIVWRTASEPDTGKARRDSIQLARDPDDVAARPIYPAPKKPIADLTAAGGSPYESPRFLRDGRILLWRYMPRGDGSVTSDLFLWDVQRGRVRRLTRNASVRDADPSPDGSFAVATRCTRGWCDLVRVDLATGALSVIAAGGPGQSFDRPRISPDGHLAAVPVNAGDGWELRIVDLSAAVPPTIAIRQPANQYDVAWADSTTLVFVSEQNGIPNIVRLDLRTHTLQPFTNTSGAAVAPEVNRSDGSIWFLSLYAAGYDLRRLAPSAFSAASLPTLDSALTPAVPLPRATVAPPGLNALSPARPFSLATRLFRWFPEPEADADAVGAALGLVSADILGRSEVIATGAFGDRASWRGASLAGVWRGTIPALRVRVFGAEQLLSASRSPVPIGPGFDMRLVGGEAALDGARQFDTWSGRYRLGGTVEQSTALGNIDRTASRDFLFGDVAVAWYQRSGHAAISETIGGEAAAGRSMGAPFNRGLATLVLSASGLAPLPVLLSGTYGRTSRDAPAFEQYALGGGPTPLLDHPLLGQRLSMPALPAAIRVGSSVRTYRIAIPVSPLTFYYWGGSTARAYSRVALWNRVVGAEWTESVAAIPMAGTPAARLLLGAGESLDSPFRHRFRAYVSLVLSP